MFPGQGSQHVGMAKDFYQEFPIARKVFDEASEGSKIDLAKLCFEGTEEELKQTEKTQPALLATSVAMHRVIEERICKSKEYAGHSLGEYSVFAAAGAMSLFESARLLECRGNFMGRVMPGESGGMAAVLFGRVENIVSKVSTLCEDISIDPEASVYPANFNTPDQVVVSGKLKGLKLFAEKAASIGGRKNIPLNVTGPFHCPLMKKAAELMVPELELVNFKTQSDKYFYSNVDANRYSFAADDFSESLKKLLPQQIYSPVLWMQSIEKAYAEGSKTFVEVGPLKVLASLVKKIAKLNAWSDIKILNVNSVADLEILEKELNG